MSEDKSGYIVSTELLEAPTKPAIQSTGVIGGVVAAIGAVATILGHELDIQALQSSVTMAITGIGGALAVFGRVRAKDRIDRLL